MDKMEFEFLVRERDTHIKTLMQAKNDLARLKKLRPRTLLQERELSTAQKIVDDELSLLRHSTKGSPPLQDSRPNRMVLLLGHCRLEVLLTKLMFQKTKKTG